MKRLTTPADLRELGSILFVGAHPDDEIWAAGGIMAAAVRNGQRVSCLTATRGEKGVQDESRWPRAQIAQIRTKELEDSLRILGLGSHMWLKYIDGECETVELAEAAGKVRAAIERFRPDTILTFGPDGYTGHPDHRAVSRWVAEAVSGGAASVGSGVRVLWTVTERQQYEQLREADKVANIFFKIDEPVLVDGADCAIDLKLPDDLTMLKRRAFEAVPSQFEKVLAARPLDKPGEALAWECFVEGGAHGK